MAYERCLLANTKKKLKKVAKQWTEIVGQQYVNEIPHYSNQVLSGKSD